jgi:hypothetical protein
VESYDHQMVYGQDTWKSVIRAVQDALPDGFARRCAQLAGTGQVTKSQRQYMRGLRGYDSKWEKEEPTSTEPSSSQVNLKPRSVEVRDR